MQGRVSLGVEDGCGAFGIGILCAASGEVVNAATGGDIVAPV